MRLPVGILLGLSVLAPLAAAQAPVADPNHAALDFVLISPKAALETDYLVPAQTEIIIRDTSRDATGVRELPGGTSSSSPVSHEVRLTWHFVGANDSAETGWQVLLEPIKPTQGGQDVPVILRITPTVQVKTHQVVVQVDGEYRHPNGYTINRSTYVMARLRPYSNFAVDVPNPIARPGQEEIVQYEVRITNAGVYPQDFSITARSDAKDLHVFVPTSMWILPGETVSENVTILTPRGKLYEFGRSAVITIQVQTPDGTTVPRVATMQIRGPYIPEYWAPVILVGLVAGAVTVTKARGALAVRRLERGRPRPVQLSPRDEVLLAQLKREDPEAYEEKRARLAAIYKERRARYRGERREQIKRDRAERKAARAEFREQKRKQAAERKEKRREAKLEKARLAKEKAASKRQAKVDAKLAKAKMRELKKTKKKLEKAQGKQAKVDAKTAKADAKRARAQEKAAASAAKAQAKADKAAAREAKKAAKKGPPGEKP